MRGSRREFLKALVGVPLLMVATPVAALTIIKGAAIGPTTGLLDTSTVYASATGRGLRSRPMGPAFLDEMGPSNAPSLMQRREVPW